MRCWPGNCARRRSFRNRGWSSASRRTMPGQSRNSNVADCAGALRRAARLTGISCLCAAHRCAILQTMTATITPFLTDYDLYLLGEGNHHHLYEKLGAPSGRTGWRPRHPLRRLGAQRVRGLPHRRLQRLAAPAALSERAGLLRRLGRLLPADSGRRPLQIRHRLAVRRLPSRQGRPVRVRRRDSAADGVEGVGPLRLPVV